ncbi:helix-turn-helix transcriptional regulator [Kitasatospora sp. NBC_01302]|uniref:helix-turn-helix transcriptional regulator n=1 Tax=Kitasatospora sp. NBC_01302 TaxID=2903575 RepID=UPI002E10697B|nr:AAA family ATPase [Kitasatospora sp. NBC_01302]
MLTTSPVLVGRDEELALVEASLQAARQGAGRAVFLLGDAGIGKSRLASESAFRAVASGLAVLRGRSSATGAAMPFRPIAEALLSLFRIGGPPQDPELAPYRSALGGLVPEWRGANPPDGTTSLVETAEAVLRLLAAVGRDPSSGQEPGCLLVIEDLHDADAETLSVIEYLVDNLAGLPVFLLVTLRPGAGAADDLARAAGRRRSAVLAELRALTPDQVRLVAESCLGAGAGQLPQPLTDKLVQDSEGNPFVVEELLSGMVAANVLLGGADGWRVSGDLSIDVPATVVHSVAQRVGRLSPVGRELLHSAAVLGRRFALPVLKLVTGLDDRSLLVHLRAGIDAQLISPSGPVADWYEFRHALTTEALLADLLPGERADIAVRAAAAVEQAYPGLPGDWCQQVAVLRLTAGDTRGAALLFAQAGQAALRDGAVTSAVSLLEHAHALISGSGPSDEAGTVLEALIYTLVETGRLDRALELADTLPLTGPGALDDARAAALHTRLAWGAVSALRHEEAAARVALVRRLLGRFDSGSITPALDVVEANLVLAGFGEASRAGGAGGVSAADGTGSAVGTAGAGAAAGEAGEHRTSQAERLARRAADDAERAGLPEVACQALQFLALLERRHGFDRADACLERLLALATRHGLTTWRLDALLRLGANEFMRNGTSEQLARAHRAAVELGAIVLGHTAEATMASQAVFRGEYATARALTDRCAEATARLGHVDNHQYLLLTRAALAAHQGRRREMEQQLAEFHRWDGDRSLKMPLVFGNCRAMCSLLEEDREQALTELDNARAWEDENPTVFYFNGRYGLRPLLRALTGRATEAEHELVRLDPGAGLLWNRQFERLAYAVHQGRAGRTEEAERAVAQAREASAPFLMARHLGLRLVAEAALADGWGDPVPWLRTAEEYFHGAGVPAVASACRDLLRRAGATVPQRRSGSDRVPPELRRQGLTAREYEVLLLLGPRLGNQEIAGRLYISPRTVEKHVASLLTKTGQSHRAALCDYAARFGPVDADSSDEPLAR